MVDIVKKQIQYRERENVTKKDFIQILIQLRNAGEINEDDKDWNVRMSDDNSKTMSIEQCAAQVFLFYIAGYDTSASTVAFCLFELSRNKEIMEKVQNEIDTVVEKYNGELSYECMNSMEYLDLCVMGKWYL